MHTNLYLQATVNVKALCRNMKYFIDLHQYTFLYTNMHLLTKSFISFSNSKIQRQIYQVLITLRGYHLIMVINVYLVT